ncbi:MAG: hypothetical protein ABI758_02380 [Candidatus Woesebacteria bacterium]
MNEQLQTKLEISDAQPTAWLSFLFSPLKHLSSRIRSPRSPALPYKEINYDDYCGRGILNDKPTEGHAEGWEDND